MALHGPRSVVFSDIDGTLVHYLKHMKVSGSVVEVHPSNFSYVPGSSSAEAADGFQGQMAPLEPSSQPPSAEAADGFTGSETSYREETSGAVPLEALPPSSTGLVGYVPASLKDDVNALKDSCGARFVLVSGARWPTVRGRADALPRAEAYVSEGGGRIFYRNEDNEWTEDLQWRRVHGSDDEAQDPPVLREPLRQLAAQLREHGVTIDDKSYETMFRVPNGIDQWPVDLPPGVSVTTNLGHTDVSLETAGKGNATRYLMEQFGVPRSAACCLCDDDNDLPMMREVGIAFVVQCTSESVAALCRESASSSTNTSNDGGICCVAMPEGGPAGTVAAVASAKRWLASAAVGAS